MQTKAGQKESITFILDVPRMFLPHPVMATMTKTGGTKAGLFRLYVLSLL
jgi:hypothetical protein